MNLPEPPLGPTEKAILDDCLRILDHIEPQCKDLHDCGIAMNAEQESIQNCRNTILKIYDKRSLWR